MSQAVPKLNTVISGLIKFFNIMDDKVPRFYGIVCRKPDNIFWKIL